MTEIITQYADFWPFYLRQHSQQRTRALHYIGTIVGLCLLGLGLAGNPALLIAVPVAAYGFAWGAHYWVERNRPATFTYPLWSLYSDLRMFALFAVGRLQPELERAGVTSITADP